MHLNVEGLAGTKIPDHVRGFYDPAKTAKWLDEKAVDNFNHWLNKMETPDYKLKVTDIKTHPKHFTLQEQKEAILHKTDLTYPIKGSFSLINKHTGETVDKKPNMTIAYLPYITPRNTTIYNGSEYNTTNQQRLKPGVYARVRETGEVEAHINVKPGTGFGGKLLFMPERALFVYQVGTMQIKLYGLLKDLGISDAEMTQAWGKEVFEKNKEAYTGSELDKFYGAIFSY